MGFQVANDKVVNIAPPVVLLFGPSNIVVTMRLRLDLGSNHQEQIKPVGRADNLEGCHCLEAGLHRMMLKHVFCEGRTLLGKRLLNKTPPSF
jgi:hypothetical protein